MTAPVRSSCVDQPPCHDEMVEEEEDDVKVEIAVSRITHVLPSIQFNIYFTVLFDAGPGSGCLIDQSCTRGTSVCFSHWSASMSITAAVYWYIFMRISLLAD